MQHSEPDLDELQAQLDAAYTHLGQLLAAGDRLNADAYEDKLTDIIQAAQAKCDAIVTAAKTTATRAARRAAARKTAAQ